MSMHTLRVCACACAYACACACACAYAPLDDIERPEDDVHREWQPKAIRPLELETGDSDRVTDGLVPICGKKKRVQGGGSGCGGKKWRVENRERVAGRGRG